jgi:NAD(P)-dependent dehydrogenase (short-subunit alcohol dehydrogenase family)
MSTYDPSFEYAYGDTPAYSVSKALLNALTRVTQREAPRGVRCVCVCPGNVASPMSTEEERRTAIPAHQAAEDILAVAFGDAAEYPGGLFYRYRQVIPW